MVIEVVGWAGSGKTHAINQEFPQRTLCGVWIPDFANKYATTSEHAHEDDEMPTCLRCADSVMKS